jgi:hypothetical protein
VWTAALQTAFGGIVASVIGYFVASKLAAKQQKEHRIDEWIQRRNRWSDELREHILEVINPATWFYLAKWKSRPSPQGDGASWDPERENYTIKLTDSITRVNLMLDINVDTHAELIEALESVRYAAFTSDTKEVAQYENAIHHLIECGRRDLSQVSAQTTPHLEPHNEPERL